MTTEQIPAAPIEVPDESSPHGEHSDPVVEPIVEPDAETMKLANAEVRTWAENTKAENDELRGTAMEGVLGQIGLSSGEGLGVAIAESYKGPITVKAVSAYATEKYKHSAGKAPVPEVVTQGETVETLLNASTPVDPPEEVDQAQEATDKMFDPEAGRKEAEASIKAKVDQFNTEHYLEK